MFKMITYVSVPYALGDLGSKNEAMKLLNKELSKFYANCTPGSAFVNALYTIYNQQDGQIVNLPAALRMLMGASSRHIIITKPGWEYSDIVLTEGALANHFRIPTTFYELYTN